MDLHSTDPTADPRDRSAAARDRPAEERDRSAGEWRGWDPADAPIAWMRKATVVEARRVWSAPWRTRRRKDASVLVRDCNLALHEGLIYSFVGDAAAESTGSRTATATAAATSTAAATPNVATPSPSASAASILQVLAGQERISGGIVSVFGESPYDNARTMDSTVLAGVSVRYPAQWRADRVLRTAARRYPNWDDDYAEMVSRTFQLDLSTKVNHLSTQARTLLGAVVAVAARAPLTLWDRPCEGLNPERRKLVMQTLVADCAAHPRTVVMNQADRGADNLVHASADRLLVVSGGTIVGDFPTDDA
ncbi:hypothetical protein [uncultured Corynebacterium sp.]|uniref:hypothetical protein n=1 Tax=uncultured Corynebacterium sp. TaxID=159447 RepID=UPI00280445C8|nr:hypothetical protein [uncultured Corynebacterium sp.]